MKKYIFLFFLLISFFKALPQERGGIVVNKFHHTLFLNKTVSAIVGSNATDAQIKNNVIAAYSVRRINSNYPFPKPIMMIRRSGDGQTQDISTTSNNSLDTNAIKTFIIGSDSALVTIWYDQSGNGRNAVQAVPAYQPRIALNGIIDKQNGIPSLFFIGDIDNSINSNCLEYTPLIPIAPGKAAHTLNCVGRADNGFGNFIAYSSTALQNQNSALGSGNTGKNRYLAIKKEIWIGGYYLNEQYAFGDMVLPELQIRTKTFDGATSWGYKSGNAYSAATPFDLGNSNIIIGVQDVDHDDPLNGWISEAIAFPAVPAVALPAVPAFPAVISPAVRKVMEADQKSYYRTP